MYETILSSDEENVVKTTLIVATWGYPVTPFDIKVMIKKYLDKKGIKIS